MSPRTDTALDADDDAVDDARHVSYPEWSDELDAIDRDTFSWLRRVAIVIIAVSLVGVVLAVAIGPAVWALRP
jgi:hypothetical protein